MAYTLAVGDIIQVSFLGAIYGQTTLNIRHYRCRTASGTMDAAAEFDALNNYMLLAAGVVDSIRALASVEWTLQQIIYQRILPTRNARYPKVINLTGSDVNSPKTANTAGVITLLTDLSTKRSLKSNLGYVGAWHQPAIPTSSYLNGAMFPVTITNMQALGNQLAHVALPITGSQYDPVIFHRKQTITANQYTVITGTLPQPTVRTQRTRTVGKGV